MATVSQTLMNAMRYRLLPALLLIASCATIDTSADTTAEPPTTRWIYNSDLPISHPPFTSVHCNWKDRIDQGYVYLEHIGPYSGTGGLLPEVHRLLAQQDIQASGPPFALYFDDPGSVSPSALRSRACVPVESWTRAAQPLSTDTLPSRTVAYAVASGAYPQVPRCYKGLFGYMDSMNWTLAGPIREIYLVPPSEVEGYESLLCEIQAPVARK